jgi:urease
MLTNTGTGTIASYKLKKRTAPVTNCRKITKRDMKHNDRLPKMTVDPETFAVKADGKLCTVEPAEVLPMTQNYALF